MFAGAFYLYVDEGDLIDWWIISRETVFILLYLSLMTFALYGNKIELWKSCILFIVYIVHIFLMKYSSKYEVAIKQMLANRMEITALKKIADTEMYRYHRNLKSQAISIEMLMKIKFEIKDQYIVFSDSLFKKKV